MGSLNYPLSQQIKDTVAVHGLEWAFKHYCLKKSGPKLSPYEWSILSLPALRAL